MNGKPATAGWWERMARAVTFGRAYQGAAFNRVTASIRAPSTSANAEVGPAAATLRNRAREQERNNPFAVKAAQVLVGNIVGDGFTPRSDCRLPDDKPDTKTNGMVAALWRDFEKQCDADGDRNFAGLQTIACHTMIGGDCLARRRWRKKADGLTVPLQIQILEGDYLDSAHDTAFAGGGYTLQGIEFDAQGRRKSYLLYKTHPGEVGLVSGGQLGESVPVKAADIAHLYEAQRAGQIRGVPWSTPVMEALRLLSDIEYAALVALKMQSSIAAFVTTEDANDPGGIGPTATDTDGNTVSRFAAGMIVTLRNGRTVNFSSPSGNTNADSLILRQRQVIAAGYRIPVELMTGDLSQVNYSSIRAGLLEFRRFVRAVQSQMFVPLFLDRVWGWFIEAAILAGKLPAREGGYPCIWQAPRFEEVDRETDANADGKQLAIAGMSPQEVVASGGRQLLDVLDEFKVAKDAAESRGLWFSWMGTPEPVAAPVPAPAPLPAPAPAPAPAPVETVATRSLDAVSGDVGGILDVVQEVAAGSISRAAGQAIITAGFPHLEAKDVDAILAPV